MSATPAVSVRARCRFRSSSDNSGWSGWLVAQGRGLSYCYEPVRPRFVSGPYDGSGEFPIEQAGWHGGLHQSEKPRVPHLRDVAPKPSAISTWPAPVTAIPQACYPRSLLMTGCVDEEWIDSCWHSLSPSSSKYDGSGIRDHVCRSDPDLRQSHE